MHVQVGVAVHCVWLQSCHIEVQLHQQKIFELWELQSTSEFSRVLQSSQSSKIFCWCSRMAVLRRSTGMDEKIGLISMPIWMSSSLNVDSMSPLLGSSSMRAKTWGKSGVVEGMMSWCTELDVSDWLKVKSSSQARSRAMRLSASARISSLCQQDVESRWALLASRATSECTQWSLCFFMSILQGRQVRRWSEVQVCWVHGFICPRLGSLHSYCRFQ